MDVSVDKQIIEQRLTQNRGERASKAPKPKHSQDYSEENKTGKGLST